MKYLFLVSVGLLILVSESCKPTNYVYRPISVRAPLMEKRNDVNIQLNTSLAGGEIYGAYSPLQNIAFSTGYTWKKDTFGPDKNSHDLEFALIPYFSKKKFRFEMPIGYASFTHKDLSTGKISDLYHRNYFQPTIGISSLYGDIAFITRFTFIDYANHAYLKDSRREFGFMFRGGYKYGKVMLQFTFDDGTNRSQKVTYHNLNIALGLSCYFNTSDFNRKNRTAKDTTGVR